MIRSMSRSDATCRQPFEAKTLIDFLTGASAKSVYRMKGMDPG
jgi:hypothetical protein